MVRHAAMLITRYWIKPSGKTSYQLIKGRRGNTKMYEFGEAVWFKIPKTKRPPGKFEEQFECGTYLGFVVRSGEDLVATKDGVFKVSTTRRKPLEERWSRDLLDGIVGTPAIPVPGTENRRIPAYAKKFSEDNKEKSDNPTFIPQPEVDKVIRKFRILKSDIQEHGP